MKPTANTMIPPKTPTLTANFPEPEWEMEEVAVAPSEIVVAEAEPVESEVAFVAVAVVPADAEGDELVPLIPLHSLSAVAKPEVRWLILLLVRQSIH
jgi:hypothetical protein